jgi:hypothetical protein
MTKKTHIYTVEVSRSNTPLVKVYVRAESKAQARTVVANTMIRVERTDPDALLDISRTDIIDATAPVADPDQGTLPIAPQTAADEMEQPE